MHRVSSKALGYGSKQTDFSPELKRPWLPSENSFLKDFRLQGFFSSQELKPLWPYLIAGWAFTAESQQLNEPANKWIKRGYHLDFTPALQGKKTRTNEEIRKISWVIACGLAARGQMERAGSLNMFLCSVTDFQFLLPMINKVWFNLSQSGVLHKRWMATPRIPN